MSERLTTSEPTTGEIMRALRYCADVNSICGDACPAHIDEAGCRTVLMQNAADRLESQEQTIAALTARAEQAEAREKAAVADLKMFRGKKCDGCFYAKKENRGSMSPCRDCQSPISNYGDGWEWRGLPQDGEGK